MSDLLHEIGQRLQADYQFKPETSGKHLRKGVCPSCSEKSLWTYAASPWVIRCERLNNCGYEAHAKQLYSELFESWTERFQEAEKAKPAAERNPNAAADAYLRLARGFDLARIAGTYTQESYYDRTADNGRGAGTSTVRFEVAQTWWERLIDRPARFGKKKANFKYGGTYAGQWWTLPSLSFVDPGPTATADTPRPPTELWLVEGIFDAIALDHHGIAAVALLSCSNYPDKALADLKVLLERQGGTVPAPKLVFALDGDKAGRDFTLKHVARAREAGWTCEAVQIPQRGRAKVDWNDLHLRGRLEASHLKEYRYRGAMLIAESAADKALLVYNHTGRAEFELEFRNRLYWWELDIERYRKARDQLTEQIKDGTTPPMSDDDQRAKALTESAVLQPIANCRPQALYYQRNETTGEAWYYFRIAFPHDGADIKGTFTAGQLTTSSEFKKQLLHMAAGAIYSGSTHQLEKMMQRQLDNIRIVQTVDFVGYSSTHKTYLLGKVAVHDGKVYDANAEDYFDIERLSIKTLQKSMSLTIDSAASNTAHTWLDHLWSAFGAKGYVALAFWFGSLFAEQVRADLQSFPFLEIVGEPGSGKTTLIQFLWKLMGRDYEGFDPSKSTQAGRLRTFTQVSNLPVVLIESDRETKSGATAHVRSFDWDELKDAYNGRSVRTTGVKTGGNETYDPPFRASIVISQNNQVQASQAIMERICHMTFDTKGHTPQSHESAKALERMEIDQVSGFILAALKREAEVLQLIRDKTEQYTKGLLEQDGVQKPRIAKNHAQVLAMAEALRVIAPISEEQWKQVRHLVLTMARERQQSINADHPLVQEFWDVFDYLNGQGGLHKDGTATGRPALDHSRQPDEIAVNLNEFVEAAASRRQQVPVLSELKKVLRTSKTRPFLDVKSVSSAIKFRSGKGEEKDVAQTVHCWVFETAKGRAARAGRKE